MKETVEEQQKATEQTARDEEADKDKKDGPQQDTLQQRLAQAQYYKVLVKSAEQRANGAFTGAGVESLTKLLGDHIRGFEKTPEGAFKLYLDEVVEVGGLVFDTTVSGKLGATEITQLSGVRATDGRQVSRITGDEQTVVAHTDSEPIRLTPKAE